MKSILLSLILLFSTGVATAQTDEVAAVLDVWAEFEAAANQLDAEAILELYAMDASRIGLDGKVAEGKDEIARSYYREMEALSQVPDLEPYSADVFVRIISPDAAILDGISNGSTRYIFTTVFAKRDGVWKIFASRPRGKLVL